MKKVVLIILIAYCSLLVSACGTGENNPVTPDKAASDKTVRSLGTYQITKTKYTNQEVTIKYPRIVSMVDTNKQEIINEILKTEAMKVLTRYENGEGLILDIDFDIKLGSENLLSLQYSGFAKTGQATSNLFYTTNVDMVKGVKLRLPDMVNVNKGFVEKFRSGTYTAKTAAENLRLEDAFNYVLQSSTPAVMASNFDNGDLLFETKNSSNTLSYLTNDSLVVSLGVPHELGDHAEFEIKYADIKDYLKFDNPAKNNLGL